MRTHLITLFFFIFAPLFEVRGQKIVLNYVDEPLNDVLIGLNDQYGIQFSISADISSECLVTVTREFSAEQDAMNLLARRCNLTVSAINRVYTFRKEDTSHKNLDDKVEEMKNYLYQGSVVEQGTGEPLPFSSVLVGGKGYVTDEAGRFSFRSQHQTEFIQLQSLGYQRSDTLILSGSELSINLIPAPVQLEEVVFQPSNLRKATFNTGVESGNLSFTNVNNSFVPGLTNNLIFNNLRLYPGIMAAGESISDFVIWGSYAGQNHVIYDGISMFNSWGVNDDIGRINPFMTKNLEVYKGGFNVAVGDRVGSLVLIEGKSGDLQKIGGGINITNQLAGGYLNIPLFKNTSALQLAGRKSYFQALDLSSSSAQENEIIVPEYDYSDFNVKFSSNLTPSDRLELSAIGSKDSYAGKFKGGLRVRSIEDIKIDSRQLGGSLRYNRNWHNGGTTALLFSFSDYDPDFTSSFLARRPDSPPADMDVDLDTLVTFAWTNPIQELRSEITHTFPASGKHQFQINGSFISNRTEIDSNFGETELISDNEPLHRFSFYGHNRINVSNNFALQLGVKAEIPMESNRVYLQPRINGRYNINSRWNIHAAWGMYNQFISRNTVIDDLGNRTDIWQVTNSAQAPVIESIHNILGVSYLVKTFELSLEGYYKTSEGFTRLNLNRQSDTFLDIGDSRSYGMDVLLRKKISKHQVWVAYSLSRVEERYSNEARTSPYRLASQSQLHEVKGSGVFNFFPFKFSITSIYGSGFPNTFSDRGEASFIPYYRTDVAFQYELAVGQTLFETGMSLLNLFDQENVRLNQSVNVPDGQVINTLGIPFTPTIFINFQF